MVVLLHGRGDSPEGRLNNQLTQALAEIDDAPVVLLANGGDSSYYHDRVDGAWATYIRTELVPDTVERFALDELRVAYAGISMGGFGRWSWCGSPAVATVQSPPSLPRYGRAPRTRRRGPLTMPRTSPATTSSVV